MRRPAPSCFKSHLDPLFLRWNLFFSRIVSYSTSAWGLWLRSPPPRPGPCSPVLPESEGLRGGARSRVPPAGAAPSPPPDAITRAPTRLLCSAPHGSGPRCFTRCQAHVCTPSSSAPAQAPSPAGPGGDPTPSAHPPGSLPGVGAGCHFLGARWPGRYKGPRAGGEGVAGGSSSARARPARGIVGKKVPGRQKEAAGGGEGRRGERVKGQQPGAPRWVPTWGEAAAAHCSAGAHAGGSWPGRAGQHPPTKPCICLATSGVGAASRIPGRKINTKHASPSPREGLQGAGLPRAGGNGACLQRGPTQRGSSLCCCPAPGLAAPRTGETCFFQRGLFVCPLTPPPPHTPPPPPRCNLFDLQIIARMFIFAPLLPFFPPCGWTPELITGDAFSFSLY